jgi:hypothetical protein
MSHFNPEKFLDAAVTTVDKRRPLLPEENPDHPKGYYLAVIGTPTANGGISNKSGKPWARIDVPLRIQVPIPVQQDLGLKAEVTLTHGVMLDLTESGAPDNGPGKNQRRRMYREAVGMNEAGTSFNFRQLEGQTVAVKIKHDSYNDVLKEEVQYVFAV